MDCYNLHYKQSEKTVLIINADEVYDDDYISRVEEINLGKFVSD